MSRRLGVSKDGQAFDTDYLLVKGEELPRAVVALRSAGHEVEPARTPTEDR